MKIEKNQFFDAADSLESERPFPLTALSLIQRLEEKSETTEFAVNAIRKCFKLPKPPNSRLGFAVGKASLLKGSSLDLSKTSPIHPVVHQPQLLYILAKKYPDALACPAAAEVLGNYFDTIQSLERHHDLLIRADYDAAKPPVEIKLNACMLAAKLPGSVVSVGEYNVNCTFISRPELIVQFFRSFYSGENLLTDSSCDYINWFRLGEAFDCTQFVATMILSGLKNSWNDKTIEFFLDFLASAKAPNLSQNLLQEVEFKLCREILGRYTDEEVLARCRERSPLVPICLTGLIKLQTRQGLFWRLFDSVEGAKHAEFYKKRLIETGDFSDITIRYKAGMPNSFNAEEPDLRQSMLHTRFISGAMSAMKELESRFGNACEVDLSRIEDFKAISMHEVAAFAYASYLGWSRELASSFDSKKILELAVFFGNEELQKTLCRFLGESLETANFHEKKQEYLDLAFKHPGLSFDEILASKILTIQGKTAAFLKKLSYLRKISVKPEKEKKHITKPMIEKLQYLTDLTEIRLMGNCTRSALYKLADTLPMLKNFKRLKTNNQLGLNLIQKDCGIEELEIDGEEYCILGALQFAAQQKSLKSLRLVNAAQYGTSFVLLPQRLELEHLSLKNFKFNNGIVAQSFVEAMLQFRSLRDLEIDKGTWKHFCITLTDSGNTALISRLQALQCLRIV